VAQLIAAEGETVDLQIHRLINSVRLWQSCIRSRWSWLL